jgi:hypothetical protein
MSQDVWSAVDSYLCDALIVPDEGLSQALRDSDAAGLPQHNVAPNQANPDPTQTSWGLDIFLSLLGDDSRLEATAIQTVGCKGYDGFSLAIVKG